MHLISGVLRCPQVSSGVPLSSMLHVIHSALDGERRLCRSFTFTVMFSMSERCSGEIKQDTDERRKKDDRRRELIFFCFICFIYFILFPCIHVGSFILSCVSFISCLQQS